MLRGLRELAGEDGEVALARLRRHAYDAEQPQLDHVTEVPARVGVALMERLFGQPVDRPRLLVGDPPSW